MINPFDLIQCENGLIAKCIFGDSTRETIENGTSLGLTSKFFNGMMNSRKFFEALILEMEPLHPYFLFTHEEKQLLLKHRFMELRDYFSWEKQPFLNLPSGEPICSKEGISLVSFNEGIQCLPLKESSTIYPCSFPKFSHSEHYFVLTEGTRVHVYNADRVTYIACFELIGEICQLAIQGHFLYVIEEADDQVCYLVTYNLECLHEEPNSIVLPGDYETPVCFGKDYALYVESFCDQDIPYAIPLISQGEWIQDDEHEGFLYYFAKEDHFIEVLFEGPYLFISSIAICENFIRTSIAENILIPKDSGSSIEDVHLHDNRLFFSYEVPKKETKLFSYDIDRKKMTVLTTVPGCDEDILINPGYLSTAEKVYYFSMKLGVAEITGHLTTLTYGKI